MFETLYDCRKCEALILHVSQSSILHVLQSSVFIWRSEVPHLYVLNSASLARSLLPFITLPGTLLSWINFTDCFLSFYISASEVRWRKSPNCSDLFQFQFMASMSTRHSQLPAKLSVSDPAKSHHVKIKFLNLSYTSYSYLLSSHVFLNFFHCTPFPN